MKTSRDRQAKRSREKGYGVQKKRVPPLPVVLLSGFLGSGKTTLLHQVLNNRNRMRVAVILNEISEINIDVLALQGAKVLQTEEKIVEMSNGCICCTLREDLLKTLRDLHKQAKFDAVVIESSGIAEPMQVAETFFVDLQDGQGPLHETTPLHNCVTVVDASTLKSFLNDPRAAMTIDPKAKDEKEDQSVGELLIQQIEFANVVVLNKVDLLQQQQQQDVVAMGDASPQDPLKSTEVLVEELRALVQSINPTATIVPAVRCGESIDIKSMITAPHFTVKWASSIIGWMDDIASGVKHVPETLEYGIGSYLYRADRPFHPARLYQWIDEMFFWKEVVVEVGGGEQGGDEGQDGEENTAEGAKEGEEKTAEIPQDGAQTNTPNTAEGCYVFGEEEKARRDTKYGNFFRSKGFIWLGNPNRVDHVMEWSQAGTVLTLQYASPWADFSTQERGQRLVFIGQNINQKQLAADLDAILLTDAEWAALQADNPPTLEDAFAPFPDLSAMDENQSCPVGHH